MTKRKVTLVKRKKSLRAKKKTIRKKRPAKKGALVRGYLEKKDRKGFEFLFSKYKEIIGDSSGIYALYKGKKLYYVGIAQNLMNRVGSHMKNKHSRKWDSVSFFVINRHRMSKDIESIILRIVFPQGNKQTGKFAKHSELQGKLNKVKKEMKAIAKKV